MTQTTLPQIQFGDYQLSRLVAGANTINGGSHLSRFVNAQMRRYFTPDQVQRFFAHCQELGVNTFQSGKGNLDAYTQYLDQGGKLHFLSLWRDNPDEPEYFLWRLMVAEPYQGRGYGRQAIERLVEYVKTRPGAKELLVSYHEGEKSPKGFYLKLGFEPTGDMAGDEFVARLSLD